MTPRGIAMMICSTKAIRPMKKEIHTQLLNTSVTGLVHSQLSPKLKVSIWPSHLKKPGIMPTSRLYMWVSCSIHSSKGLEPGCMDF